MPLYCEEVQDILGRIPGKILRIGLAVILGIMLMLLVGSYFFKYPEIVQCPVVLTTINPPLELYVKSAGKIERLCVKEHDQVMPGQIIAVIENTASYEDAIVLEKQLEKFPGVVHWDSIVRNQEMDGMLSLGELQNSYISFCKAWTNFRHYLEQNHLPMKINLLKQQILKQKEAYLELCQQKKLMLQDFNLASKQFQRDSTFYRKYNHAMSEVEYETHMQNYLQKKSSYISFSSSVKNVENNMLKLNENQIDLEIQYEKELNQFRLDMDETYQLLGEAYRQWKERYVITSTITGLITFTGYWSENQMVKSGERMATVVPQEDMQIIGRAVISMAGIGKVKKGQRVNIKLNGFPFMEYGMLRGEINNISLVPEKDVGYIAEIVLTGGMKSSYREQLSFIQEMDGVAEIITKEGRLLSRLINPFKSKLNE